jgi:DNA-binding NarL/FixJ family response regulator
MSNSDLAGSPAMWSEALRRIECLTPREQDVLELVALGYASKEIADRWTISSTTVDIHRRNVLAKLRARSMCDAVRLAVYASLARRDRNRQNGSISQALGSRCGQPSRNAAKA